MKKTIITLMLGMLLLVSLVSAQPVPKPVVFTVQVNGQNVNYDDVKVTNLATGEVITKAEASQLEIMGGLGGFDLSQFELGYTDYVARFNYPGDEIEARVCDFHADCTVKFHAAYTSPNDFRFDVRVVDSTKYVCSDGSVVSAVSQCPKPPVVDDDDDVVVIVDPPVDDETEDGIFFSLVELLGALLIALGVGWRAGYLGLVKYYWKKGEKKRAIKMLFTATKRAKEDYYNKK